METCLKEKIYKYPRNIGKDVQSYNTHIPFSLIRLTNFLKLDNIQGW